MNFLKIFNKTPNYRRFNYTPRYYNPEEEERKERIGRIEREVNEAQASEAKEPMDASSDYRQRMKGSFRQARQNAGMAPATSSSSSPTFLRLLILLVLTVGLIMYLQFGKAALYGIAISLAVIFFYSKLKSSVKKS